MAGTLNNAFLFLVNTLFNVYLFILCIRLILAWVGADYHEPLTQFIVRFTNFIVKPLRRYVPNFRDLETSTLILILAIEAIKFFFLAILSFGLPNIFGLLIFAFADTLRLFITTFFYAILLQAIISWIQPQSPINYVLTKFCSPVLRPLQRIIPPINGFDITPIPAFIILQLLIIVLVDPLIAIGWKFAFG